MNKPQLVDPFVVTRRPQLQTSRPSTAATVRRRVPASAPVVSPISKSAPSTTPVEPSTNRRWSFEEPETWRERPFKTFCLIVGGLLLGGLSLFSLELGELALAVYAIVAIVRRWPSRQAFAVALGMFAGIIVTSLVNPWRQLADNLAVYAFLLLCLGTLLMAMEMRRDARRNGAVAPVPVDEPDTSPEDGVYYRHRSV